MSKPGINAARWNNGAMGTKTEGSWYSHHRRNVPTEYDLGKANQEYDLGIRSGKVKEVFVSRNAFF
jgi:hypothetical protein